MTANGRSAQWKQGHQSNGLYLCRQISSSLPMPDLSTLFIYSHPLFYLRILTMEEVSGCEWLSLLHSVIILLICHPTCSWRFWHVFRFRGLQYFKLKVIKTNVKVLRKKVVLYLLLPTMTQKFWQFHFVYKCNIMFCAKLLYPNYKEHRSSGLSSILARLCTRSSAPLPPPLFVCPMGDSRKS